MTDMKNKKLIGFVIILFTISCKSQSILPLENLVNYINTDTGIPSQITYVKDINNILDKYVGNWKGNSSDKSYFFQIEKIVEQSEVTGIRYDMLVIKYKITSVKLGEVIVDNLNFPNNHFSVMSGWYLSKSGTNYVLIYQGFDYLCGDRGDVYISIGQNLNSLQVTFRPKGKFATCTKKNVPQIMPLEQIYLTKQ